MYFTDYPQVYMRGTRPHSRDEVFLRSGLLCAKEGLLFYGITDIPAGCLLIYCAPSNIEREDVFFTLLTDIKVSELGSPKARRAFVEAGSCAQRVPDDRTHIEVPAGFIMDRVRLPYFSEVELYKSYKTI